MNLEQQVINLEYAKRLKELGVEQKSLFVWCEYPSNSPPFTMQYSITMFGDVEDYAYEMHRDKWSAFTVAELGEMFDRELKIHSGKTVNGLELYYCSFIESSSEECWNKTHCFDGDTEANARAKMLVHLIENDLYDPQNQKTQTKV